MHEPIAAVGQAANRELAGAIGRRRGHACERQRLGCFAAEDVGERVDLNFGDRRTGLVDDDAGDDAFDVEDELHRDLGLAR